MDSVTWSVVSGQHRFSRFSAQSLDGRKAVQASGARCNNDRTQRRFTMSYDWQCGPVSRLSGRQQPKAAGRQVISCDPSHGAFPASIRADDQTRLMYLGLTTPTDDADWVLPVLPVASGLVSGTACPATGRPQSADLWGSSSSSAAVSLLGLLSASYTMSVDFCKMAAT